MTVHRYTYRFNEIILYDFVNLKIFGAVNISNL
jgi:hypothetical protein